MQSYKEKGSNRLKVTKKGNPVRLPQVYCEVHVALVDMEINFRVEFVEEFASVLEPFKVQ